jgi:hypothetical protein
VASCCEVVGDCDATEESTALDLGEDLEAFELPTAVI